MNRKASELMGEPVLAAVRLDCPQNIKEMMSWGEVDSSVNSPVQQLIGGAVGNVAGHLAVGNSHTVASLPGDAVVYYVAVGPSKVAFFSLKTGLIRHSLDRLLVEHPRSDLRALEIKMGYMSQVHFVFADGVHYFLMCARMERSKLKKVQELLSAT